MPMFLQHTVSHERLQFVNRVQPIRPHDSKHENMIRVEKCICTRALYQGPFLSLRGIATYRCETIDMIAQSRDPLSFFSISLCMLVVHPSSMGIGIWSDSL